MKRVLIVFGTRPGAIKMAPVIQQVSASKSLRGVVCVTGQHREMLDQVLGVFAIRPQFDLNIMRPQQDLCDLTSRVLCGMREVLRSTKPDVVLVHGDTTTSMAAALASSYQQIPVGHVEAGLRTHDIEAPWPEEINRQITARVAKYHFAPTAGARRNLLEERIPEDSIFVTGNTVIDALKQIIAGLAAMPQMEAATRNYLSRILLFDPVRHRLILVTGHRRENCGDGIGNICRALKTIARKYEDAQIVYPIHMNPLVQKPVRAALDGVPNIHVISPLSYVAFVYLMSKSFIVLTDSGGIQEEAPSLGKPVLVLRETTERPEAVSAGTVRLVGTDCDRIVDETSRLMDDSSWYGSMASARNPYGDGFAATRIRSVLEDGAEDGSVAPFDRAEDPLPFG